MLVTKDTLDNTISLLRLQNEIALDTETTGRKHKDRIFGYSIAWEGHEYYFDKRQLGDDFYQGLYYIMQCPRLIYQNAKFDMNMVRKEGLPYGQMSIDIAVVARILRNDLMPNEKAYSLAFQAARAHMEKDKRVDKYIKDNNLYRYETLRTGEIEKIPCFDKVPLDIMSRYAAHDARITYDLWKRYEKKLDPEDWQVLNVEIKLTPICADIEWRGVKCDLEYTMWAKIEEAQLMNLAKLDFYELTGKEFADKKSLLVPIFEQAGEKIVLTDKGNPKLDGDVLDSYSSPVAKIVQRIRDHQKRISTYYDNFLNLADDEGIIRASMWQSGTRTGRFSYSAPNFQNVPKDETGTTCIRRCIVPRPGTMFVSADYQAQEYRMMLAYAGQRNVIYDVMNGKDLHQSVADMLNITRKHAKTTSFAVLYGSGVNKLAEMLGISVHEARRIKTRYFLQLPYVERFIADVIRKGEIRGYVKNWFGRKLYADREHCYALPNHLIQGGSADCVKVAMTNIKNDIVLQVHDQLVFEVSIGTDVAEYIKLMESAFPERNGMVLKVEESHSLVSFAESDMVKGKYNG